MKSSEDIRLLNDTIFQESLFIERLVKECQKVIVGQEKMLERLIIALLSGGHILLEGLPGLAKTLAIKTLSNAVDGSFSRVQFTPDLLPADIVGTMIYNPQTSTFNAKKGPVFANFILADEINRAPAKVQSALLEAMQERQVTIGTETFPLPQPFLVLATQNPIEQEGTYPLPEAQLDRFMLKVTINYPTMEEERHILQSNLSGKVDQVIKPVIGLTDIVKARKIVKEVYMDDKIEQYILDIIFASRHPKGDLKHLIGFGGSPRATISLAMASKSMAFIRRRGYVVPEDVRAVCSDVLRHRIGLTYEAEAENINQEHIVESILNSVQVP